MPANLRPLAPLSAAHLSASSLARMAHAAQPRSRKSRLLDLAYDEYCDRVEEGEQLSVEEFCAEFPEYKSSVRRMLELYHQMGRRMRRPVAQSVGWPEPGGVFNGFVLLRELGRGSFARVFLAKQPALGDRLAVAKVAAAPSREAMIMGRLKHPNIVPVHWVETAAPFQVMCMPYLGAATLCDVMDKAFKTGSCVRDAQVILEAAQADLPAAPALDEEKEPITPDPFLTKARYVEGIAHLGGQLAAALDAAHRQKICHRDLKPSNVLLTPEGRPMLLDFNLSQEVEDDSGQMGGTLAYMAPEQLEFLYSPREPGQPRPRPDARADLFSLGVVLYELLTGRSPFGPVTPEMLQPTTALQARQVPPPPSLFNPDVTATLDHIILQCLAANPQERWQTAEELAAALQACAQRPERRRQWYRRAMSGAVLLTAILLTGVVTHSSAKGQVEETKTQPKDHYGEGLAQIRAGHFADARLSLQQAYDRTKDAKCQALMGYCATKEEKPNYPAAVLYYEQAVKQGFRSPAVLNNYGHSLWLAGLPLQAVGYLDEALEAHPNFSIALHNRAMLEFDLVHQKNTAYHSNLARAAELIEKALQLEEVGAWHVDAARVYALAAQKDPQQTRLAIRHLVRALDMGVDPVVLGKSPLLKTTLKNEPVFEELKKRPKPALQPQPRSGMVNPLPQEGLLVS
jgi:serine/threonine protein kinase